MAFAAMHDGFTAAVDVVQRPCKSNSLGEGDGLSVHVVQRRELQQMWCPFCSFPHSMSRGCIFLHTLLFS